MHILDTQLYVMISWIHKPKLYQFHAQLSLLGSFLPKEICMQLCYNHLYIPFEILLLVQTSKKWPQNGKQRGISLTNIDKNQNVTWMINFANMSIYLLQSTWFCFNFKYNLNFFVIPRDTNWWIICVTVEHYYIILITTHHLVYPKYDYVVISRNIISPQIFSEKLCLFWHTFHQCINFRIYY